MLKREEYPSKGELVVVKIKRITQHGAFADLIEYGKEGFIHISQIASSWVKNIRSHVSEGQIRVAQVTHIDPRKNLIDISLREVNTNQEKRKISEWKRNKKAEKLLELVAKSMGVPLEEAYRKVGISLEDEFGDMYSAFEDMVIEGDRALENIKIPDDWKKALMSVAKKYVEIPRVEIKGEMIVEIPGSGGIDKIKSILGGIEEEAKLVYKGAPVYMLKIEDADYKSAEAKLTKIVNRVEKEVKSAGGQFEFKRLEE